MIGFHQTEMVQSLARKSRRGFHTVNGSGTRRAGRRLITPDTGAEVVRHLSATMPYLYAVAEGTEIGVTRSD